MTKILVTLAILACSPGYGQTKRKATDEEKLSKCLLENTSYFTFSGQQPIGKGWEVLENLFSENQFVAWGEYHNSALLSQLTSFALKSASKRGFKTWCVETSPFVAAELSRIAGTENPQDSFLKIAKERPNFTTFPFFETREDINMLLAARESGYSIWGIDQEFQMTFPYDLDKIYMGQTKKFKVKYQPLYDSLKAKWWNPETILLDSLKKVVKQSNYKKLLDDIKVSKDIYYYSDNQKRADLMKSNFYHYYNAQRSRDEKIFFKMGSNHLAKGLNLQTNIYDIGNAVYELSQRNQTKFVNVCMMVRYTADKGVITDDLEQTESDYPKVFLKLYDKEKWVLADIRSLRLKMKYDHSLTPDTYKIIEKYDYVLVSPEILQ